MRASFLFLMLATGCVQRLDLPGGQSASRESDASLDDATIASDAATDADADIAPDAADEPSEAACAIDLLAGDYHLDFYASSGSCVEEVYVRASATELETNIQPLREPGYPIGSFCHDRRFGDMPPVDPAACSTHVETNTLSCRAFESTWTSPVVIDGIAERRAYSRFTLQLVSDGRLQADLVGFDREGVVPEPIFRCFYDRS